MDLRPSIAGGATAAVAAPLAAALAPRDAAACGSQWDAADGILVTRLSGRPTPEQVRQWEAELRATADATGAARLRVLVDLVGYEAGDVPWAVHREQREVVPRLLRALGHPARFLGAASGARAPAAPTRVVAVAHVHHDRDKMALYEAALASANERYFSDRGEARRWLRAFGRGAQAAIVAGAETQWFRAPR